MGYYTLCTHLGVFAHILFLDLCTSIHRVRYISSQTEYILSLYSRGRTWLSFLNYGMKILKIQISNLPLALSRHFSSLVNLHGLIHRIRKIKWFFFFLIFHVHFNLFYLLINFIYLFFCMCSLKWRILITCKLDLWGGLVHDYSVQKIWINCWS